MSGKIFLVSYSICIPLIMSENMWTSSKCRKGLYLSAIAFGFISIVTTAVILVPVFVLFIEDCVGCSMYSKLLGIIAGALFAAGLLILSAILCYKRRHINMTPRAVVSLIPTEDLEKSAAPILHFVHVPHRLPFMETSSIDSLPDYFTVVPNPDKVYLSVDADVWTEHISESPPPRYEEALEMTTFGA